MKLSTRSRYGMRMMYELAMNYGKVPIIIKDIARRQAISEKYLSRLIIPLKGAHLVNSARGAHGGYTLARDPSMITLLQIVEILEGDITIVECVKNKGVCVRSTTCPTRNIWCQLDRSISGFLNGITLEELAKNSETEAFNYCI